MKSRILFVCLGNICRSPAAEAIFLGKIQKRGLLKDFEVDSAGTGAWHVGKLADSRMRDSALERGIEIRSIARKIKLSDFLDFDLILTMDNDNLHAVNQLACSQDLDYNVKIEPILSYAKRTKLLEVPDPYYGGSKGFEKVLDLLDDACEGLLESFKK